MWRLFIVDFLWSRSIAGGGWRLGLLMMLCGVLLVSVAIAFGGGSVQGQRFGNVNQSAIAPSVVLSGMGRASPPVFAI